MDGRGRGERKKQQRCAEGARRNSRRRRRPPSPTADVQKKKHIARAGCFPRVMAVHRAVKLARRRGQAVEHRHMYHAGIERGGARVVAVTIGMWAGGARERGIGSLLAPVSVIPPSSDMTASRPRAVAKESIAEFDVSRERWMRGQRPSCARGDARRQPPPCSPSLIR